MRSILQKRKKYFPHVSLKNTRRFLLYLSRRSHHIHSTDAQESMPSSCACPIWYHGSAATKAKDGIVRDIFRVCLYTSKHFIGFLLGVFALFLFIFPLFPQYVLSFRSKSAAGLSVWFVFLWLVGDTMNMTSCVLTRQTPLQLYTAIYFAVSDIFLVAQVCWYEHLLYSCRPRVSRVYYHVLEESEREDNEMMDSESGLQSRALPPSETLSETTPSPRRRHHLQATPSAIALFLFLFPISSFALFAHRGYCTSTFPLLAVQRKSSERRKLISSTGCIVRTLNISRTEQQFGRASGYISASCYIFGRFFQISKNFVRKSTKGISLYMFCTVALANMLYAAAILLQKESKEERMNSFTFLLGSLGTISCDLVIFIQSRVYRRSVREE